MRILLSSVYPYVFAALIFIIPFDHFVRAWPNILLIVLAVSFPFVINKNDFKIIDRKLFILLIIFLLFLLVNSLVSGNWGNNHMIIEKVGIAIGLFVLYLPISETKKIDNAIIFSSIAAVIYSFFNIMMLIKNTGEFNFSNNANPLNALLIDRLYLGLLSVLSIIISYKNLTKKYNSYNKYYLINIIINVAFLFTIVARMALITLVILAIVWFFYHKLKKRTAIIGGLTIVLVLSLAFAFNNNMAKRFFYDTEHNKNTSLIQKTLDWEPRTVIWNCAYQLIKKGDDVWLGKGFKQSKAELVDCYGTADINEGRREWFLFKKYNSHNQFLDFYLSTGVIAFLLFTLLFIYLFVKSRNDYFSVSLIISLFLFLNIENIFHRQIGAYYFGVFLIYVSLNHKKMKQNTLN